MRVTSLWQTRQKPTLSFELFPARTPKSAESMVKVVEDLAALQPDFVSVTFGAGGSTKEGSYQLIKKIRDEYNLEVVAYFAGYGLGPDYIQGVLDGYRSLGVETILVVRGDPPKESEGFQPHPQSLAHASDLLAFIKDRYQFCLGAAGYPEGHIEAESKQKDLEYLKLKVGSGAEFIISNYFYDNRFYFDYLDRCRSLGVAVPILPGVMPIYSVKMMEMLAGLCGAVITDQVRAGLASLAPGDAQAVTALGVDLALDQCRGLLQKGAPGIHMYTMDRSESVKKIVNRLRADGLL